MFPTTKLFNYLFFSSPLQAGAQISLADVSCSEERCTKWYNLLSRAHARDTTKDKASRPVGGSDGVRVPHLSRERSTCCRY